MNSRTLMFEENDRLDLIERGRGKINTISTSKTKNKIVSRKNPNENSGKTPSKKGKNPVDYGFLRN